VARAAQSVASGVHLHDGQFVKMELDIVRYGVPDGGGQIGFDGKILV
jgi:hypothetical protein